MTHENVMPILFEVSSEGKYMHIEKKETKITRQRLPESSRGANSKFLLVEFQSHVCSTQTCD